MNKTLIIARGIPGCGKSTFARLIADPGCICTADDYHMINGKYDWKPENSGKAHLECQNKCERLMKMKTVDTIIVANTSTTEKEMKPYYDLAKIYQYKVFSIIIENRHNGVNEHNVSEATITAMKARFDIKL